MKYVLALLLLIIPAALYCEGLRTFTDKTGRTVKAKIIKVDKQSKKVTVELENKKTATVAIDIFSEEDQNYIQSWTPSPPDNKEPQPKDKKEPVAQTLSKEQIESIIQKYERICTYSLSTSENRNEDELLELKSMWLGDNSDIDVRFISYEKIRINEFVKNGAILEIYERVVRGTKKEKGYILITNDGKIKYDSAFRRHPIEIASDACSRILYFARQEDDGIFTADEHEYTYLYEQLVSTKIPLFGLSLEKKPYNKLESIEKIEEWIRENGEKWDNSEPKLFLPKYY